MIFSTLRDFCFHFRSVDGTCCGRWLSDIAFRPDRSIGSDQKHRKNWTDGFPRIERTDADTMFSILETVLSSVRKHRFGTFGDSVDRLNHQYTVLLLLFLALAVCAKQYVGEPIQCWLPHEYRSTWEQYIETFCFVESTYFIPLDERVAEQSRFTGMNYRKISYYQWVPVVLAIQAALFYAPHAMWKACSDVSGIRLYSIMKTVLESSTTTSADAASRKQRVRLLAQQIDRSLNRQRGHRRAVGVRYPCITGIHLCTLYLLHKFFYVLNAVVQFLILNSFLNTDYDSWLWGLRILRDLTASTPIEWTQSGHFPRLAVCNYPVRRKSENVWESAQCVLMINMLNEKIYVFLWFWLAFVFATSVLNLIWTLWSICRTSTVCRVIDEYLSEKVDAGYIGRFVNEFLALDGCLVLRFVQRCGDEVMNSELVDVLFEMFVLHDQEQYELRRASKPPVVGSPNERPPQFRGGSQRGRPYKHGGPNNTPLKEKIGDDTEEDEDIKLYCVDEQKEVGRKLL